MASRVASPKPSMAAMSAPRSHRVCTISRALPRSFTAIEATRSTFASGDASGIAWRSA